MGAYGTSVLDVPRLFPQFGNTLASRLRTRDEVFPPREVKDPWAKSGGGCGCGGGGDCSCGGGGSCGSGCGGSGSGSCAGKQRQKRHLDADEMAPVPGWTMTWEEAGISPLEAPRLFPQFGNTLASRLRMRDEVFQPNGVEDPWAQSGGSGGLLADVVDDGDIRDPDRGAGPAGRVQRWEREAARVAGQSLVPNQQLLAVPHGVRAVSPVIPGGWVVAVAAAAGILAITTSTEPEERESCETRWPGLPECWDIEDEYEFPSLGSCGEHLADLSCKPPYRLRWQQAPSTGTQCPGSSSPAIHVNYYCPNHIGTCICCWCCSDLEQGPRRYTMCKATY